MNFQNAEHKGKLKKSGPVYGRSLADEEYKEIFDAVLNYGVPEEEEVEVSQQDTENVEEKGDYV